MAEAEDVILEAAERVAAGVRALWERRRDPGDAAAGAAAAGRRRLDCWLSACVGRSFVLAEVDAPARPGWLARMWGRLAPWERRPLAVASTDGRSLFLPHHALVRLGSSPAGADLLTALGLGLRAARGWHEAALQRLPLERDVVWLLEGTLVDAALARALPGLTPEIEAARRRAAAARPARASLRSAELAVEELAGTLLRAPLDDTPVQIAHLLAGAPTPSRAAAFAARFAAALDGVERQAYRGMAPVLHWGVLGAPSGGGQPAAGDPGARRRTGAVESRRLRRRIARRGPDPSDPAAQTGPFLLPSSDAHLSVQDPRGLERPPDEGHEEVDALAEEVSRLPELATVGGAHAVREFLEVGASSRSRRPGAAQSDAEAPVLVYPEWDHRRQAYRARGCLLREREAPIGAPGWSNGVTHDRAALMRRVRRQFEAVRPRRRRLPRRLDGDGIDFDGWALELAERRAGQAPGRLYTEERPARRDVAVALLLDASGSTDAWVSRSQRVIDVAKEAALCFCGALAALGDRLAVYAFSGLGPGDVRVWVPKRFEDPYGERVRARIGALEPDRFTRLGGPLRHVTASLGRTGARVRLLLLLSDGKPNDEDSYEGEYGVEDVRQAVVEARALGVRPFCITIDREGPGYLPRIFGPAGYTVLWDIEQLPLRLPSIYRQLTAGAG